MYLQWYDRGEKIVILEMYNKIIEIRYHASN